MITRMPHYSLRQSGDSIKMATIPFVGAAYDGQSTENNNQRCVNWFLENSVDVQSDGTVGSKHANMLLPTPGLKSFAVISGSNSIGRGIIEHKGLIYTVIDRTFYTVDAAGMSTSKGTLLDSLTGPVSMAAIDDEIVMVDGARGYSFKISTSTFAEITGTALPVGTKSITSQDSFFLAADPTSGKFYISSLNDGTAWAALDFASAEGSPDKLQAIVSNHREIWMFGERTTEVWFNSGATFPFARIEGVFLNQGLASPYGWASLDNTLFWLAQSKDGSGSVIRANGFIPEIISTPAVSFQLNKYTTIDDAIAFAYYKDGHEFFVLTFPTEGRTWTYDVSTRSWFEQSSEIAGVDSRWLPSAYAAAFGKHIVCDSTTGDLLEIDGDTFTDNGTNIIRKRITQAANVEDKWLTINSLKIDFESGVGLQTGQGSDPQAMLRVSKDGGHTYGNQLLRSPGKSGVHNERAVWNRLGAGRTFKFELTCTDPVKWIILGAYADIELGGN